MMRLRAAVLRLLAVGDCSTSSRAPSAIPGCGCRKSPRRLFIYAIFIGAAVATRRNDHLYLTAISEALHGTPRLIVEIIIRLVVLGVAFCLIWFGYINYLRGFGSFRLPSGTPIASLYAAIPLSGVLIALFTIEQLVNGIRNGFDHPEPPDEDLRFRRSMSACRRGRGRERAGHPGADVVLLPVLRLSRRAGAVLADGRRFRRRAVDRRLAGGDHPEDFRRRGFRSAAGDPVLPAGRRAHEFGQRGGANRQSVAVAGRTYQGRAVAGRRRVQHVLLGNVGIDHRRRRGDEPRAGRPDEARRLQPGLHRRDHRVRLDHRGAGAAEHHRRGLWRGRQRLDRRPVHGGRGAGLHDRLRPDDLLLFLRPLRHAQAARAVAPGRVRRPETRRCR